MIDETDRKKIQALLKSFLTTNKVAAKVGLTPVRIRQLIADKTLPAILIGGIYFIDPEDLHLIRDRNKKPGPKKKIINLREPE
jgi:hypothetical protein